MSYLDIARKVMASLRTDAQVAKAADDLLDELAQRGCLLRLEDDGSLVGDNIPEDLADSVAENAAMLVSILEAEADEIANGLFRDKSDQTDWWSMLTPEEQEVLKPQPIKRRCPWCKHIKHTAICNELRPKRLMLIGKYKGMPIEDLPRDYVHWLAGSRVRLDKETRSEIYDRFGIVADDQTERRGMEDTHDENVR